MPAGTGRSSARASGRRRSPPTSATPSACWTAPTKSRDSSQRIVTGLPDDPRRLLREAVDRREPCARRRGRPTPLRLSTNQTTSASAAMTPMPTANCRRRSRTVGGSRRTGAVKSSSAAARLLDQLVELLVALARVGDPQLLVAVVHEQELVRVVLVPVQLAVEGLRGAVGSVPRVDRGARSTRNATSSPSDDEERKPDRDRGAQLVGAEDPEDDERDEHDADGGAGRPGAAPLARPRGDGSALA